MEYGSIEGVNKKISRLVQGCIMLHSNKLEESFALLDTAYAAGVTAYDSAHLYSGGEVDRVLGLWMEEYGNREEIVLIGKGAHLNQDRNRVTCHDIASDMADSRSACAATISTSTYCIAMTQPSRLARSLMHLMSITQRAAFASLAAPTGRPNVEEANEYADKKGLVPFAVSSPNFSLAEQVEEPWTDCLSISGASQEAARQWYASKNMPLFTWSSVARGFFSGKITSANAEEVRDQFDGSMPKSYYYPENFKRLDRAWELAEEKGLTVPQIALSYVLSFPLDIYALVAAQIATKSLLTFRLCKAV